MVPDKLDVRYRLAQGLDKLHNPSGVLHQYRMAGYLEAILMVWNFIPRKGVYPLRTKIKRWGPFKWHSKETYIQYIARKTEDLLVHLEMEELSRDLDMSTYRR